MGWAALAAPALGCGRDPVDPEPGPVVEVVLSDQTLRFQPEQLEIEVGTLVRWRNGARFHTITPDDASQSGAWVGAPVSGIGEVFEHRFTRAGTYHYYCEPHLGAGMIGRIVVR